MVDIEFSDNFSKIFSKIKDNFFREVIKKQIKKIALNPEIGKPLRNVRKRTRELYIKPYRLSYAYDLKNNVVFVLDLYHKNKQ